MIVNRGANKSQKIQDTTVDGVLINVYLLAAVANTAITAATFLPEEVTITVNLKRNNVITPIIQNNLRVLGLYNAYNYGLNDWIHGNRMTAAAGGVFADMFTTLFIQFGGPLNLKADDELTIQVLVSGAAFGAAYNQSDSYVEFNPNEAPGAYEKGVPQQNFQVVQANIGQEQYYLGDGVTKIMQMNFDKTTLATRVISSCAITSDKFDKMMNFYDMWNRDGNVMVPPRLEQRFTTTDFDIATLAFPIYKRYPQTFCLYAAQGGREIPLNGARLNNTYNGAQVAVNENYVGWTRLIQTQESVIRGTERAEKHSAENFQSLPSGEKGIAIIS